MSLRRAVLFGVALLTFSQVAHSMAEPALAYVAAKNANPKRLDVFKKGLAELGYAEGKNIRIEYREALLDADYDTSTGFCAAPIQLTCRSPVRPNSP
jgi:hypothetical protein